VGDASSPVGAISLTYDAPRPFSREDEEFLLTLARLCGQALQRARLADQALQASEAYRGSLVDSLQDQVVVLDPQGFIVEVNEAWRRFAAENGGDPVASGLGANYLAQCERVSPGDDGGIASAALRGIKDVIASRAERFALEYPCHAPDRRRWFVLRVARAAGRAPGSVVLSHSDVTTIKQAEERLREALAEKDTLVREVHEQNARVEEANRLKSEFLANMSHELRTPLNGIIGFSELISDGKAGPISDVQREYLGDVLSSARHLHELINDVLDLTRVESGKLVFHHEPVDLGAVLRDACDIMGPVAAQKRISLETRVEPGLDDVTLDAQRFKQVLFNYLSNALKFTPEQGRVRVTLEPAGGDRLLLEVEDTGIGIKPEDMPRLFVEFQQLDASKAKKYPGTGLGLALTRRIVEAQGGQVGARSEKGKGSVFFAVLPRRPAEPTAATGAPPGKEPPWHAS
jgi:signal transduction histidine kinase